ncbi:Rrf2 family nitric oxide-sensitive transcriptional repressor [Methylobacterium sp. PvP062]|jgi:Rrf2 family transcriptional regulator, nitric oxide-sensitive transcriptional repressor|uniref:Transcriptional regulator, BadM/Rrf2 family n=2 Tax=Methylobacterium radiotolerans TaxID=31998 RepID=B1LVW8_METRJ|nr:MULTISPECIES: Rrf2 family transcriptional regulator [Methylobacterium]MBE7247320.1 Rrf2 family transcriptional regulator [Actinomycetospora chiangmaiensis]MCX7331109.1 Rrf2 family transcriptional regulator [Hyphomicrobiales bacterium]ACB25618.1 transcriptional regulator, BadM/Rrf2 family [Methylobacterium radiotolerans JCM 2831]KIU31067.1 Rrf2 family transcriptional regulator [Methylobacterium radiotolerans]MBP2496632.1 Rrf2 family nitric oxide-sensitive transcriptional repressor [Methyloba
MRLTRYTDYALRTLIYVGLHEPEQSSIAAIARAYGISENHLTKVVHQLGRLGLIRTIRGRGGGLRLAMPPGEIVVGAVVRQTEDDLALVECFGGGACAITAPCRLRRVLGEALAAFLAVLDRYTLADLLGSPDGDAIAALLGLAGPPGGEPPMPAGAAGLPEA